MIIKMEGDILSESQKKEGFKLSEVVIIVLITSIFSIFAGVSYGKMKYSETVNINNFSSEETDELNEFIKQYKYIISNYYDQSKIDESELLSIALKSVLDKLGMSDSYSLYMDEEEYSELNISLNGSYEGLGISATKESNDGYILIVGIIDNSPASKSELKVGDYILSIDGKSSKDMTVQEFSQYVLKSSDKNFVLKIKSGVEEKSITLGKDSVELESVTSKIIEKDNKKIGYIYASIFASNTYIQFKDNLEKLEESGIDSLIIDLRGNSGGHLKEVSKILNLFLDDDNVIYQLQKDDKTVKYYSKGKSNKKYPIVFIGDETTASASEVFIISLRENLNAKFVGKKTYGKGTVQELIELSNGDKYKITTKKWLSPNGNWINDTKGIIPDVEVELLDKYYEEPTDLNDTQLQKAIELSVQKK